MEAVVERGHRARPRRFDGYTIAGKTGTAAKLVNGRYSKSDYNASFVGFVPSRKPALTIVVVIDSPHAQRLLRAAPSPAPVFKRIAEAALRHLGVGPTVNAPPPVLVARHDAAVDDGLTRAARARGRRTSTAPSDRRRTGQMPDLRGLSAREALRALTRSA